MNILYHYFLIPPLHPLFWRALALIMGITLQAYTPLTIPFVSLIIIASIALFLYAPKKLFIIPFIVITALFGAFLYKQHIENHQFYSEKLASTTESLTGVVKDVEPIQHLHHAQQKILIQLKNANFANKKILLYVSKPTKMQPGDSIKLTPMHFQKKAGSFYTYLIKENIIGTAFIKQLSYHHLEHADYSSVRFFHNLKQKLFLRLKTKFTTKTFALFSALFLGNKNGVKSELTELKSPYQSWGVMHHLARSGLHLILIILVWKMLLAMLPLSFALKQLFMVGISGIYYLLSWPTLSFVRAFLLLLLSIFCALQKRQPSALHLLTIITLYALVTNPMRLFFLDFQLSFGITFALAWLTQLNQLHKKTLLLKALPQTRSIQ